MFGYTSHLSFSLCCYIWIFTFSFIVFSGFLVMLCNAFAFFSFCVIFWVVCMRLYTFSYRLIWWVWSSATFLRFVSRGCSFGVFWLPFCSGFLLSAYSGYLDFAFLELWCVFRINILFSPFHWVLCFPADRNRCHTCVSLLYMFCTCVIGAFRFLCFPLLLFRYCFLMSCVLRACGGISYIYHSAILYIVTGILLVSWEAFVVPLGFSGTPGINCICVTCLTAAFRAPALHYIYNLTY